jgi:hypothetical protein
MMELSDQMAFFPDKSSVRHLVCCWTLFNGRFTLLTRFRVCVNQASALDCKTTLTVERGAKAAAEAGSSWIGMVMVGALCGARRRYWRGQRINKIREQTKVKNRCLRRIYFFQGAP